MKAGVLALQGDYEAHARRLRELGVEPLYVRKEADLSGAQALIFPGGESTAMLKLMSSELSDSICEKIRSGLPVLATCAGVILLARNVSEPEQSSLGLLDIDVVRNSYGRQIDSFITRELEWTAQGRDALHALANGSSEQFETVEGVFIRAPRISRVGQDVRVYIKSGEDPVFVNERNIFAACFHPELSESAGVIHRLFLGMSSIA